MLQRCVEEPSVYMGVIKGAIHHQCAEYLKGLKNNFHLLELILKIAETWLPLP